MDLTGSPLTWRESTCELAWAAGFFDGEGCTRNGSTKRRPREVRIAVSLSQQSRSAEIVPSVLFRFQRAMGGLGYIAAPFLDRRSGTYAHMWRASSFEEAQAVIALLWRWLGPVKREQAASALKRFRAQYETVGSNYRTPGRPRHFAVLSGPSASMAEQSVAWAAGLFDGEGSTELHVRRVGEHTWFGLRSRVSQCDAAGVPDVLRRFKQVVRCGWIEGPTSGEGYENAYKWAAGADETLAALRLLWPFLGVVKRVQAIEVIASVDALPVRRRHHWRNEARRFVAEHGAETVATEAALTA